MARWRTCSAITTCAWSRLKSFCTGAQGSDLLLVSATEEGRPELQVAVLPTRRDGITIHDDWANMGQRQTDSGSVSFADVVVGDDERLRPPGPGGSVWASLRPCVTQSILSNVFLGIAEGAFDVARGYTRALARPFFGSSAERATDDPYILEHYVRTLTLHDPLDYKVREVGDWVLNDRPPTPSFYS
jgi:alkylation response protein AidB-like acyl-CoA dehydrogenase